jgi:uncharacterized protein (DUF58 family)
MAIGLAAQRASILAWGGALIVGLAIARAVTRVSVTRIRNAGFEMLWSTEKRVSRVARGETVTLEAEIRNRDTRAARYVHLRGVCSPHLEITADPPEGEVPAGGRLRVKLSVSTPRVGSHGIFGLSLEVQGSPGLFEVPLTFANPYGIEVLPKPFSISMRSARGGRSRIAAAEGRSGPLPGDGSELRELREHRSGDPFKRIAWKATARRGELLVRDYERQERDIVWLVLDASVELWSGAPGHAPLDVAIDEAAAVAQRHLALGARVGLAVLGARRLDWVPPERGPAHCLKLFSRLALRATCNAADRSDWDESDVALRVLEHMRPLEPALRELKPNDLDGIARQAERLRARGPLSSNSPYAETHRERELRRYLNAFGIHAPARLEPDRKKTDEQMERALGELSRARPRPSIVYIWSPAPDPAHRPEIARALNRYRRGFELFWISMLGEKSIERGIGGIAEAVADAVLTRAIVAEERGERALRALGVRVEKVRPKLALWPKDAVPRRVA